MACRRLQFDRTIVQAAVALLVTLGAAAEGGASVAAMSQRRTMLPLRQASDRPVLARWMSDLTSMVRAFAPNGQWLAADPAWIVGLTGFDDPQVAHRVILSIVPSVRSHLRAVVTDLPPPDSISI